MYALLAAAALLMPVSATQAVDSSQLVPESTYAKALGEGFTKAIIRGYMEACGSGGEVDPNFVQTYNNAVAAGYTDIDVYWYPCSGSGNSCKSYSQQLSELASAFQGLNIGTIWLDIERDNTCNGFNYGAQGNIEQAQAMAGALNDAGYNWGIYSSPGEWSNIFGSYDAVVDNSVPLWYATYDGVESTNLETPFGGWTSAVGKQYTDQSASGLFDLSVFN